MYGIWPPAGDTSWRALKPDDLQAIIAFGLILLLPSVAQMIKDALKVEGFKYAKDISAAASAGVWPFRFLYEQRRERIARQKEQQSLREALNPQQG